MTKHKIRHVPILDNNQLVGMVSIGDVVNRLIEIYAEENAQIKWHETEIGAEKAAPGRIQIE